MSRLSMFRVAFLGLALSAFGAASCGDASESAVGEAKEAWKAPAPGSCDESGMLTVANEATLDELDNDAKLTNRAAKSIIAARPIASIKDLDAVSQVGATTLNAILKYARAEHGGSCSGSEIGIVSDLDDTVIPAANPELSKPPFPGVAKLYQLLENRNDGETTDMHYVTARLPARVVGVPAYLEENDVPPGPIETGVSGIPAVAENEKVRDITRILEATGTQRFVLFGDATHRDPEVYQRILAASPDRVAGVIIHRVGETVPPERVDGLHLVDNYAEAAAVLFGLELLTRTEALSVMKAAKAEGLEISTAQMNALLDAQK